VALRQEGPTIERLLEADIGLIAWSREIAEAIERLTVDDGRAES
jgi:hypothetical protein